MGQGAYDADESAGAREGYLEVRALMTRQSERNKFKYVGSSQSSKTFQKFTKVELADRTKSMRSLYDAAKLAKVGSTIACPTCSTEHVKTTYHKVFCNNGRTQKGGNCKDVYHNSVSETRSARANLVLAAKGL